MPEMLTQAWAYVALTALLVTASVTDIRTGKIPNWVTYPGVLIGLTGHTLTGGLVMGEMPHLGLLGALMGLGVGFLPLYLAYRAGGIGGGDAKIMGAIGAMAGWHLALETLFMGLLVAVVMAFLIMFRKRIFMRTMGRVLRFLYLALTPTKSPDPATAQSPTVPFGLALCIGAGLALAEQWLVPWLRLF